MRRRSVRGLTLTEVVVTILLVGLFIVILSDLTTRLNAANAQSDRKSQLLELLQTVTAELKNEIEGAVAVVEPSGTTGTTLELDTLPFQQTFSTASSPRLPSPPVVPAPAWGPPWLPNNPAHQVRVVYSRVDGFLQRSYDGGPAIRLAEVEDFSTSLARPGVYQFSLVVKQSAGSQRLKGVVYKP